MKSRKKCYFLFLLCFLGGCNYYEKIMAPALKAKIADKNPNPVFDGEVEPSMPDPKENDKTVLGIDTNKNEIRDDIDIWINRTGNNYNERMALRQLAKAYREKWIAGAMAYENFKKGPINQFNTQEMEYNREISKKVQSSASKEADATMGCMTFIFKPKHADEEIANLETKLYELYKNSELRDEARKAFYHYNHSFVATEDKKNEYEYCLFKIENLDQAIQDYRNSIKIAREKAGYNSGKK